MTEYLFNTVLFDLDGTLVDSQHGILYCLREILLRFGIEREESALYKYLGPPLQDTFREFFDEPALVEEATRDYRALYRKQGVYDAQVYPGIPELLKALNAAGIICRVATSKPQVSAAAVLTHFGLAEHFDRICGVSLEADGVTKADVIRQALTGLSSAARPVMVGDRKYDMDGAAQCGIPAVGVAYGYGARQELAAYRPVKICASAQELCAWLLQG